MPQNMNFFVLFLCFFALSFVVQCTTLHFNCGLASECPATLGVSIRRRCDVSLTKYWVEGVAPKNGDSFVITNCAVALKTNKTMTITSLQMGPNSNGNWSYVNFSFDAPTIIGTVNGIGSVNVTHGDMSVRQGDWSGPAFRVYGIMSWGDMTAYEIDLGGQHPFGMEAKNISAEVYLSMTDLKADYVTTQGKVHLHADTILKGIYMEGNANIPPTKKTWAMTYGRPDRVDHFYVGPKMTKGYINYGILRVKSMDLNGVNLNVARGALVSETDLVFDNNMTVLFDLTSIRAPHIHIHNATLDVTERGTIFGDIMVHSGINLIGNLTVVGNLAISSEGSEPRPIVTANVKKDSHSISYPSIHVENGTLSEAKFDVQFTFTPDLPLALFSFERNMSGFNSDIRCLNDDITMQWTDTAIWFVNSAFNGTFPPVVPPPSVAPVMAPNVAPSTIPATPPTVAPMLSPKAAPTAAPIVPPVPPTAPVTTPAVTPVNEPASDPDSSTTIIVVIAVVSAILLAALAVYFIRKRAASRKYARVGDDSTDLMQINE